jgi:UDP-N-acetylmuramoyl-tripeptide--D-alanyl-D-alanine ligase
MIEDRYSIAQASADLAVAGLLDGVVTGAAGGPVFHSSVDGDYSPEAGFTGAGLDSRALVHDQLFVALKGERVDGRDFIPGVLQAGHWVLAENPDHQQENIVPSSWDVTAGTGIILTRDATAAVACLAAAWRSRLNVRVAGVTGTNGKTTTKDLLAAILHGAGPTWATVGNFNNRLGLPLTLLGLTREHKFAVIEMGASAVGDIASLAPLAAPHTGVITNASPAHLAEFGSLEDIIQGKGELLDSLPADGCAVLNADSPGYDAWCRRAACRVVTFGRTTADHVWDWQPGEPDGQPQVQLDGQTWPVPLPGEHNGANLVAALLAARSFGLTDGVIRAGLAGFKGSAHRGVLMEIGGRIVLDDSYNANPVSMAAAGLALGRLPGNGKTVAVLGAMAELGPESDQIHQQTGRELASGPVDILIAVGKNARLLGVGFDAGGGVSHYCVDLKEAARLTALHTSVGDRLLIKGSRSAAMEEILPLLAKAFLTN